MPRHNRRPPRNRRTHYWQKHHLSRQPEQAAPEEPQEILISVRILPRSGKKSYCETR